MKQKIIAVSGYFIWLHIGHIEYFKEAKKLGRLIVILNNDTQQEMKYGKVVVPWRERLEIIKSIRYVDQVILSQDTDKTVCNTLISLRPYIFANGGDRNNKNIPEADMCKAYKIKMKFGLGKKIQSSSSLMDNIKRL